MPFFYDIELDMIFTGQSKKEGLYYIHPELIKVLNKYRAKKGFAPISIFDTNLLISGRLWKGRKVMSFWTYPDKNLFTKIIDDLELKSSLHIWNNDWLIEVVIDNKDKIVKDLPYNWKEDSTIEKGNIKLILVDDFEKSKDFKREKHILSPIDKKDIKNYNKKYYKPDGVSDIEYKNMMRNLYQERTNTKPKRSKIEVNYEAIINDFKGNVSKYITKFKLIKSENGYVECNAQGYKKEKIDGFKSKVWVSFKEDLRIEIKSFKTGTVSLLVIK